MIACPNCSSSKTGEYCADCGQNLAAKQSVLQWSREFFAEQFSLSARLPRTMWLLFTKPGALPAEWSAGRRARYVDPVRIFLLALVIGLTAISLFGAGSNVWVGSEQLRVAVDGTLRDRAQLSVILTTVILVPALALIVKLVLMPQRTWYVDHLVFAIYFAALTLFVVAMTWPIEQRLAGVGFGVGIGWIIIYLVLAMQRAYDLRSGRDALRIFAVILAGAVATRGVIVTSMQGTRAELLKLQFMSRRAQLDQRTLADADTTFWVALAASDGGSPAPPLTDIQRAVDAHLELVPKSDTEARRAQTALLLLMAADTSHAIRYCQRSLSASPASSVGLATCLRIAHAVGDSAKIDEYGGRLLRSAHAEGAGRSATHRAIILGAIALTQQGIAGPRSPH